MPPPPRENLQSKTPGSGPYILAYFQPGKHTVQHIRRFQDAQLARQTATRLNKELATNDPRDVGTLLDYFFIDSLLNLPWFKRLDMVFKDKLATVTEEK